MTLTTFLLAHLAANITRVPYDAEELRQAYWGQGGKGQPMLMDIADAMLREVKQTCCCCAAPGYSAKQCMTAAGNKTPCRCDCHRGKTGPKP